MLGAIIHDIIRNFILRAVIGIGLMALTTAYIAYDLHDKNHNYVPVQARVTDVKDLCFLERRGPGARETSDMMFCFAAETAKKQPKWQGFYIKHKVTVVYEFTSPVDNKPHTGRREYEAFPDDKPPRQGDRFSLRASKTDAEKTREI